MTRSAMCPLAVLLVVLSCGADWLQFRGANGASLSPDPAPPDSWTETKNVAWKASLPGRGVSGPIVVKGRTYVTCSSGVKQDRLHVLCFDNATGAEVWQREFWATGRTLTHPYSAVAAPTPPPF